MLESSGLMAFVGVSDLVRAQQFYGDTLGLRLRDESPFALVADLHGGTLRITAVGELLVAAPYTVLGWQVADIASSIEELTAHGVCFTRYPEVAQDDRGVWTAPGGAKVAWFLDPDGNTLSLTEFAEPEGEVP